MTHVATQTNPWFSIWTKPRETIQSIVNRNPEYLVIPLAALAGVSEALDKASTKSVGDSLSLPGVFLLAVVAGSISGIIGLYIFGYLLKVTGKWLGGQSDAQNIRTAIAWSSVPVIWALLLWVPELLIFGNDLFTSPTPRVEAHPYVYFGFLGVELVIAIWSLMIFFKCLGQVQGFSAWRGLGSAVLALVLVLVPFLLLALIVVVTK